ncbi:MAG TPA: ABC transporter permease subunit [Symbiobacteriaceae bacterium]|jgi:putative spermidine/putrescine transport system permease protein
MKRRDLWPYLAVTPLLILLLLFEVLPAVQVMWASVHLPSGAFSLENFKDVFTGAIWQAAMKNSFFLTLWSTLAGLGLSVLGAWALSRSTGRVREVVAALVSLCINFAGVPLTFAFIILLGSSGVVAYLFQMAGSDLRNHFNLFGPSGLALVYIYFQIPLGIFLMLPAFAGLRREWEEAAENLGARSWQFWRYVGLPVLTPAMAATASVLFANALGAQATAYAMTNGMMNIMTVRMSRLVSGDVDYEPNLASAAAVVLALLMVVALLINQTLSRRFSAYTREGR